MGNVFWTWWLLGGVSEVVFRGVYLCVFIVLHIAVWGDWLMGNVFWTGWLLGDVSEVVFRGMIQVFFVLFILHMWLQ